ncbi:hypothetical membrane protein [Thermoplasma acidophilum]|uniref:Hypothetical membrane protein n=1 Tax=Thermoplasma acidophilum (strain ATCC 25905 / DSM 1728 / JCM 9062 / NBRC 15155 / AMRC-C165) TaxID=273075 RepID=Q9HIM2_THEAC|nr:hypothetical protein [Thermoplasma acidophilum]CAC12438.1 hypothetical membrane protein [Thermoplasma acidophilum]
MISPEAGVILIIIALIVIRSSIRAFHGRRYSRARLIRLPILYLILSVALLLVDFPRTPIYYSVMLLIPAGYAMGTRFGTQASFFYRSNVLYFKRSPVIFIIWMCSFLARISLEFFVPASPMINLIIDAVLSFTAGMILGESVYLLSSRKDVMESNSDNSEI